MLYVLRMADTDYVKVGYTNGVDARTRSTQLQPGCPFALHVELVLPGERFEEIELHKKLKQHHVRGEWFKLTPQEVRELIGVTPSAPEYTGPPPPGDEPASDLPPARKQAVDAMRHVLRFNHALAQYPDAQMLIDMALPSLADAAASCFDEQVRAKQLAEVVERHQRWERAHDEHAAWHAHGHAPIRRLRLVDGKLDCQYAVRPLDADKSSFSVPVPPPPPTPQL